LAKSHFNHLSDGQNLGPTSDPIRALKSLRLDKEETGDLTTRDGKGPKYSSLELQRAISDRLGPWL